MKTQIENKENLPYKFTKNVNPLIGEEFRKVCDYDLIYSVSNFGRVRKDKRGTILTPHRPGGTGKIYVRLLKRQFVRVQDLMYRAFFGSIPNNMQIMCKDNNRQNLTLENLILKPQRIKRGQVERVMKKRIPRAEQMIGLQKEQTIDLNKGDKAAKLAELNEMLRYYYPHKIEKGVYFLKLKNS